MSDIADDSPLRVAVIGGGVGGYTAAIRCAQLGATVTLVEDDDLGGTCLNRGCIPTKAFVRSASVYRDMLRAQEFGLSAHDVSVDMSAVVSRSDDIVAGLRMGVERLLKSNGVTHVKGRARVQSHGVLSIASTGSAAAGDAVPTSLEWDRLIIATGGRPAAPQGLEVDGDTTIDSDGALTMEVLPESVIVYGGGIIAVEFAWILSSFGSKVTLVSRSRILRTTCDEPLSAQVKRILASAGVEVLEGVTIDKRSKDGGGVRVGLSSGDSMTADKLLVATGRSAVTDGLGLDEAGVALRGREIEVDSGLRTSVDGIFAVGDVIGPPYLAHAAAAEAKIAAANACGGEEALDHSTTPNTIFLSPEIAWVGESAAGAKEKGIEVSPARFHIAALGRAHAERETHGYVDLVVRAADSVVIGGAVITAHAGELIHEIAVAVRKGLTAAELAELPHQHPTMSEAIMEASEAALGVAIHQAPRRSR